MNFYIPSRISQEQAQVEQARRQAVLQSGYSFIVLQLLDRKKSRVSGVECLKMRKQESQENPGMEEFVFDVSTGPLVFEADPQRGGMMTAYLLDTDWNRAILGTHRQYNFWRPVDVISGTREDVKAITLKEVLDDVQTRSEHTAKAILRTPKTESPNMLPASTKMNVEELPEEEIENRIKRLIAEKDRRGNLKKNKEEMAKHPVGVMRQKNARPEASPQPDSLVVVN